MKNQNVLIEIENAVASVRLNRPTAHNGMDFDMLDAVLAAARSLHGKRDLRAVILSGEGPSFCAGLDFKTVLGKPAQAALGYAQLWLPYANKFQRWSLAWRELGVPVIAAVHGNCFGAGIQLALGADIRIATPDARISIMESKWGLIPDMGGAVLLRELLAIDVAKELTFSGRIISGSDAQALGLVTHVADDPLLQARELAAEFATRSPDALAAGKFLLQEAWHASESDAASAERHWQRVLIGSKNQRISIERNTKKSTQPFVPRKIRD
ncbi:MAG: enoyl-CoA hydratase [Nevskia sp.]|nr:enoyl-CoA hydratase [Nevskia sp.]